MGSPVFLSGIYEERFEYDPSTLLVGLTKFNTAGVNTYRKAVQSGSGYVCRVLHGRTAPTLLVQESPGQILSNAYPTLDLTDPGIAPSPDLLHASAASSASAILPLPRDGDRRG
jgi:hypothetical protein